MKRERSSNGADLENNPATKKSKKSESAATGVSQSTSKSANDPSVRDPISGQQEQQQLLQPCTSHQISVPFVSGNSLSPGEATAKQHGNN